MFTFCHLRIDAKGGVKRGYSQKARNALGGIYVIIMYNIIILNVFSKSNTVKLGNGKKTYKIIGRSTGASGRGGELHL